MMISIIISALLLFSSYCSPCAPKYLLPQIISDTITINSFNTTTPTSQAIYSYSYFKNLFYNQMKVILSINELVSNKFTLLNYQVSAKVQPNSLDFYFTSKNMTWTSIQIQFFLHSRTDIYSRIQTISILNTQQNTTVQYPIPNSQPDSSFIAAHFIIGVIAMASSNYQMGIQPFSVAASHYQIVAFSNVQAAITIQTVYIDSLQKTFSYSFDQFQFYYKSSEQYKTLWAGFAPTIYTIYGLSRINVKGNACSIKSNYNIANHLFTVDNMIGAQSLAIAYFAIGQIPSKVCSPCNNFISVSGCLDVCPNNSFPQNWPQGGKTCRICNSLLGQTVANSNSCTCPNGQKYYKGNCYKANQIPTICKDYEVLVNNRCLNIYQKCSQNEIYDRESSNCVCKLNFQKLVGICTQICPVNSKRDGRGSCKCNNGFLMNTDKKCESICTLNSYYDARSSKCLCNTNFQMRKGKCVQCQSNEVYDTPSKLCLAKSVSRVGIANSVVTTICQPYEIIVNGVCVCSKQSILSNNNKCVLCPEATYKVSQHQCAQCIEYCNNCQNNDSCLQCNSGFTLNNQKCAQICGDGKKFILPCDDGNMVNGDGCSSACQIQDGFVCNGGNKNHADVCKRTTQSTKISITIASKTPTYISAGIITEFILQPPVQRSRDELYQLFKISFSVQTKKPKLIILSQSDSDYRSVRCFFDYNNALPNGYFKTQFIVTDKKYGQSTISIPYSTFSIPITSAIKYQYEQEQDLLS